jgi:MFS family permease
MPEEPVDRSYRALLRVPGLGRVVTSMTLARIAQSMVGVAIVLFVLAEYHSPSLAGIVTFASIFPGLLIAPVAGALLDRHGRVRLMVLDYVVALVGLALIGLLSLAGLLPAWLLVLITIVTSLTSILSVVGLRTLFPIMAPVELWERVNAVDSNGYVVATILGPPLAAALVAFIGAPEAMIAIAIPLGLAAVAIVGLKEPKTEYASTGRLFHDAWQGVRYAWGNRTIRGLGFSFSVLNVAWGSMTIVIPIVVLDVLHLGVEMVGIVFAVSGVSGMISAIFFGRLDTRGREWRMLVIPMLLMAPTVLLVLPATGALGPIAPMTGLVLLAASMFIFGLLNGCSDIALFTVRQRRTDPAWMGRAFAVSMAFNFAGFPIGAAVAGVVVTDSLGLVVVFAMAASLVGALLAAVLVPHTAPTFSGATRVAVPATADAPEFSG